MKVFILFLLFLIVSSWTRGILYFFYIYYIIIFYKIQKFIFLSIASNFFRIKSNFLLILFSSLSSITCRNSSIFIASAFYIYKPIEKILRASMKPKPLLLPIFYFGSKSIAVPRKRQFFFHDIFYLVGDKYHE